ncbi:hypothetical protein BS50DRAFT_658181 [Corynespora cassiicola Philippines]|uniref:Isomerase YbhE n=1 Tax=Corynespora cassiicola Philippines TaxID=1448308 RepID=A0A2T2P3V5_CORCC|nr:hypothetical protein BS50DRAFT_658181 [Corynespora cassiicola Philippines]
MQYLPPLFLLLVCAQALVHHLFSTRQFIFGSHPGDGTISKYSIGSDFSLKIQGSIEVPHSCNATKFSSLHLSSADQPPYNIYGSASTGTCSAMFSISSTGSQTLRSAEVAGDIRSFAWSPNGRHLHALNSRASTASATSILNYYIDEHPSLTDLRVTDLLQNVTSAEQLVSHPSGKRVYLVTKTNDLITIPLLNTTGVDSSVSPSRHAVLPSSIDASLFTTSTLAISSSNTMLWTVSQSPNQAIISVFALNPTTGEVVQAVARSTWAGNGVPTLVAAPFEGNDVVAVTNSPVGMVAFMYLEQGAAAATTAVTTTDDGMDFLKEMDAMDTAVSAAAKIKAFGRLDLGFENIGEGVWVN